MRDHLWAERLVSWGYVTLQVDSFNPRNISSVCTLGGRESDDMLARRVTDAYDAQHFLNTLPFVNYKRIAVMGWSNGGATTLNVLYPKRVDPFHAAVAMYPSCRKSLADLTAPLLILIGAKDDWTPAERCVAMMPSGKNNYDVTLQVYPDAYLIKKNVKPYEAKQLKDMLLIAVRVGKTLTGLQIIMPDGTKKFLTGTEKGGAYLAIPGTGKTVYLVEGWATGCTVHELTGAPVY